MNTRYSSWLLPVITGTRLNRPLLIAAVGDCGSSVPSIIAYKVEGAMLTNDAAGTARRHAAVAAELSPPQFTKLASKIPDGSEGSRPVVSAAASGITKPK